MKGTLIFCGRNFTATDKITVDEITRRFEKFFTDLVEIAYEHNNEIGFAYDADFIGCKPDATIDIISFAERVLDKRERSLFL